MEIICPTCKKSFIYKDGPAHFKRSKNHYCSRSCQNTIHGKAIRGKQDKRYKIWMNVKKRAKKKGIEFDLGWADIPKIPSKCPILGIDIKANNISSPLDSSPSLDRINPKEGYVKDNIRIISNRANRIKSDSNIDELRLILKDMENYESV